MGLHKEKDLLDRVFILGVPSCFFLAAVCVDRVEEAEQAAADQKGIAVASFTAGLVGSVQRVGDFIMKGRAFVNGPLKAEITLPQWAQDIAPCPVVLNLIVYEGERENYILVFHSDAGRAVNGVELARKDGHDRARLHRVLARTDGNRAASFLDIYDLHLFMPVEIDAGKILRDRTQIGVIGKTRLLVEECFFILGVFFEIHRVKPFRN